MEFRKQYWQPLWTYATLSIQSAAMHSLEARRGARVARGYHSTLYTLETTFSYQRTDGVRILVQRGIKQADPLSPFLFNSVLDPLVHDLNSNSLRLTIGREVVATLAYADNAILVTSSIEELRHNLAVAEKYFKTVGLALNRKKTVLRVEVGCWLHPVVGLRGPRASTC